MSKDTPSDSTSLQWLVLPDELEKTYTNTGGEHPGDAVALVASVNANPALGQGHNDWRVPRIDELMTLIGAKDSPNSRTPYWSCTPFHGKRGEGVWCVAFISSIDYDVTPWAAQSDMSLRLVRNAAP